jgi:hypothetical protein
VWLFFASKGELASCETFRGITVTVIDLSRLDEVVEEVHPLDGRRRRHLEHAFCVLQRRCCNERFDARIAPPIDDGEIDEEEYEQHKQLDEESLSIMDELDKLWVEAHCPDGTTIKIDELMDAEIDIDLPDDTKSDVDLADKPKDSEESCELECCMTQFDDLEAHDRFFDRELMPLPSFG